MERKDYNLQIKILSIQNKRQTCVGVGGESLIGVYLMKAMKKHFVIILSDEGEKLSERDELAMIIKETFQCRS